MIPYATLLQEYVKNISRHIDFAHMNTSSAEVDFGYQTQVSAVYSANIEGNTLDINSFMNQKQIQKKENRKKYKK